MTGGGSAGPWALVSAVAIGVLSRDRRQRIVVTDDSDLEALRTIADYQFGAGAGEALVPPGDPPEVRRTASGRPNQLIGETGRLATLGRDGRLTLGFAGGRRLVAALEAPAGRVVVGDESVPYVGDGANAFAKFVVDVDPAIRARDEVLVVGPSRSDLVGVGRAELSARDMADFDRGAAVSIREGRSEWADPA